MSISVQGISKSFKGRRKGESDNQVLKDVSFEIEEGQFVCLLGPAGLRDPVVRLLMLCAFPA